MSSALVIVILLLQFCWKGTDKSKVITDQHKSQCSQKLTITNALLISVRSSYIAGRLNEVRHNESLPSDNSSNYHVDILTQPNSEVSNPCAGMAGNQS